MVADGAETLEEAQRTKLDLVCRKLQLKPGDRLLDVGCGWGSFIVHAAREYGARATGVTLSEPQAERARQRAEEEGVGDEERPLRPGPARGEHTEAVLRELCGYDDEALGELRAAGVFG